MKRRGFLAWLLAIVLAPLLGWPEPKPQYMVYLVCIDYTRDQRFSGGVR